MGANQIRKIPDVAISDTAVTSAMVAFGLLALILFVAMAFAIWQKKRRERDGIYSKYKLPGDPQKIRR